MALYRLGGIFVLKRRTLHRDMADVNVYTARRLKSMALSLGGLAQAFADEIGGRRRYAAIVHGATCIMAAAGTTVIISIICFGRSSRKGKSTWRTCLACFMRSVPRERHICGN